MESFQVYNDNTNSSQSVSKIEIISADGNLSPRAKISILNTDENELDIFLPKGVEGTRKVVKLLHSLNKAIISVEDGGTFALTPSLPQRELFFINGMWETYTKDSYMYYPTEQQGGELFPSDVANPALYIGSRTSISGDGNTLAIGGYGDSTSKGAVWVYTRTNGVWSQQGSKLVGTGGTATDYQGRSISLSADGNTLAAGGYEDVSTGFVWIYTRNENVWTQQGNKFSGSGGSVNDQQGRSVSLSADGNTLALSGNNDGSSVGAVWIFSRTNNVWNQVGSKLVPTDGVLALAGNSICLSADGNTLAIGGSSDNTNIGATWIFVKTDGNWVQQGLKLIGTGADGKANQGHSVSLSADGNTLASGGYGDDTNNGAVWIFTRTNGTWSQQGQKLIGNGADGKANQGSSVSLSADGNTLAVGGDGDDTFKGSVWVYTRINGVWEQSGDKLTGTGRNGYSVSLNANGDTLASGSLSSGTGVLIFT